MTIICKVENCRNTIVMGNRRGLCSIHLDQWINEINDKVNKKLGR